MYKITDFMVNLIGSHVVRYSHKTSSMFLPAKRQTSLPLDVNNKQFYGTICL
jgi:hypothetical protein